MWPLLGLVRRHPWVTSVAAYGMLFSAADVAQQVLSRPHLDLAEQEYLDLKQTGKVALVGFSFHANFNYFWFRSLEHLLPGANAARVIVKVACDQALAAPLTIGAFYAGLSLLDGESNIFGNLQEKFWPTYKAGVLCWTLFQAVNFTLVPPVLRTAFVGVCSFLWTTFLCYLRQNDADETTSRMFQALPGLAGLFPSTRNENGHLVSANVARPDCMWSDAYQSGPFPGIKQRRCKDDADPLCNGPDALKHDLLVLWPTVLQGCLQCDEKFKENVAKLRTELVPRQIHDTRLKSRAEALLTGLEGDFFLHYATSQFSGFAVKSIVDTLIQEVRSQTEELAQSNLIDQALLDELVEFRKKTTLKLKKALKEHQMKACDKTNCAWLRYSVLDCVGCQDINAVCYTQSQCFVDSQDRLSLRYGPVLWDPKITQNGVAIVLCMGGVLFLVIIGSIITYWRNQLFLYV